MGTPARTCPKQASRTAAHPVRSSPLPRVGIDVTAGAPKRTRSPGFCGRTLREHRISRLVGAVPGTTGVVAQVQRRRRSEIDRPSVTMVAEADGADTARTPGTGKHDP